MRLANQSNMERRVFSANCAEQLDISMKKVKQGPSLTPYTEQFEINHKPKFKTQSHKTS